MLSFLSCIGNVLLSSIHYSDNSICCQNMRATHLQFTYFRSNFVISILAIQFLNIFQLSWNLLFCYIYSSVWMFYTALFGLFVYVTFMASFHFCAGFEVWSNLHKLEILDLSYNLLNDSTILSLDTLPSLHSLYLSENRITNAQILKSEHHECTCFLWMGKM